jgi:hypothetical protein
MLKKLMRLTVGLILMVVMLPANAAIITFENYANNTDAQQVQDGFLFVFNALGWGILDDSFVGVGWPYNSNGTTRLMLAGGSPGQVTISSQNGLAFSLNGFSAATMFPNFWGTISLTGYLENGGTISSSLSIHNGFDNYTIAGFNNLMGVTFAESVSGSFKDTPGLALDNLNITPKIVLALSNSNVPEPNIMVIFLLALAVFYWQCNHKYLLKF